MEVEVEVTFRDCLSDALFVFPALIATSTSLMPSNLHHYRPSTSQGNDEVRIIMPLLQERDTVASSNGTEGNEP